MVEGLASRKLTRRNTGQDCDIKATLPLPTGGKAELWVVCKSNPRPHQIAYDRTQDFPSSQGKRQNRIWVLAAPFVSPRMAQLCQELALELV